jgi:hypothetical protein
MALPFVLQEHCSQLGTRSASAWRLGLGAFLHEQPLGIVTLRARDFPVVREVTTSSWLALPHQGYGTEAHAVAPGCSCWRSATWEPTLHSPKCSSTTTPRRASPASWAT